MDKYRNLVTELKKKKIVKHEGDCDTCCRSLEHTQKFKNKLDGLKIQTIQITALLDPLEYSVEYWRPMETCRKTTS